MENPTPFSHSSIHTKKTTNRSTNTSSMPTNLTGKPFTLLCTNAINEEIQLYLIRVIISAITLVSDTTNEYDGNVIDVPPTNNIACYNQSTNQTSRNNVAAADFLCTHLQ